jgi:hypothetical protein
MMKINRTFCLDVDVARELRKRSNQSYLVNRLLKQALFDDQEELDIRTMSATRVAAILHNKVDDEFMKTLLARFISSNRDANL